jgi:hypothetical protein
MGTCQEFCVRGHTLTAERWRSVWRSGTS